MVGRITGSRDNIFSIKVRVATDIPQSRGNGTKLGVAFEGDKGVGGAVGMVNGALRLISEYKFRPIIDIIENVISDRQLLKMLPKAKTSLLVKSTVVRPRAGNPSGAIKERAPPGPYLFQLIVMTINIINMMIIR